MGKDLRRRFWVTRRGEERGRCTGVNTYCSKMVRDVGCGMRDSGIREEGRGKGDEK